MSVMERWMKAVDYRITEGSEHMYNCYEHGYCLDSWSGTQDGYSFTIVFSTKSPTVYELQAHDYANGRAYRWQAEEHREAYEAECRANGSDPKNAWDDLNYVDLETLDDYFQKVEGIKSGMPYDTRVSVPIDLPDSDLFQLMKLAHEEDITLNQMVERLLMRAIEQKREEA